MRHIKRSDKTGELWDTDRAIFINNFMFPIYDVISHHKLSAPFQTNHGISSEEQL